LPYEKKKKNHRAKNAQRRVGLKEKEKQ